MKKIDKYEVRMDLYYDPTNHFWIDTDGKKATIGMSPLVQETSGSFVAIILEDAGKKLLKGEGFGTAEAEKHVGPLKVPLTGTILSINNNVIENPRLINSNPYNEGWLIEMEVGEWENEKSHLIHGEENIITWFKNELKKFDEKGWIAH